MASFTKKQLIKMKKGGDRLTKKVINVLLSKGSVSEIESYINDLLYVYGGCQSGMEGDLIYYKDTVKFYKKYNKEIKQLLKETLEDTGLKSPKELFGEKWDDDDPFAEDYLNQNLLAWFGFEETVRKVAYELEVDV